MTGEHLDLMKHFYWQGIAETSGLLKWNHLPGNRLIAGHFLKNIIWETLLLHNPSFEKSRVQLATVQYQK